ncbi:MAG: NrtA/SsuA/CpmA family ABC transporter substrate-binding protein [Candidatus Scalindua sp.]
MEATVKMRARLIISIFLVAGVILLTTTTFLKTGKAEKHSTLATPDPCIHPIYSNYRFNKAEDIINLGVQPIYSPTGLISETMKRDAVLHEILSGLGAKIRFYAFLKGDDVNCFLKQGDIDVGIGGDMPAITASANMDVIVPALIQQGFTSIVARQPMLIRELRGKKVGYAFGSNAHYALLRSLSSDGLNEAQVNLIPMEINEMPEALQTGKIEAFSAWEPISTIALMKYPENVVIHRYLSSGYIYFMKTFSDRHPKVVRHIIAAEIRALRWMQSNRQYLLQASEWAIQAGEDLTNHKLELSVEQNASLAESDILGLTSAPIIPQNDLRQDGVLHKEFEFLKTLGKVPASTNWDKVYNSFDLQTIINVLANSNKYKLNEFDYDE